MPTPTGLALDRTELCALLSLVSARSVYGVANLEPQASTAAAGLKKLASRGLLKGQKADELLRLMAVVAAPRFVAVAEGVSGDAALHYLDPPVCVALEGGLAGFRVGLVGSVDLLARRVLRFVGFDPALEAVGETFMVAEAAVAKASSAEVPPSLADALLAKNPSVGGQLLLLRGSGELARKARLLARPGGEGFVLYRPEATQPQLRVEPLSAASLTGVINTFIAWLAAKEPK